MIGISSATKLTPAMKQFVEVKQKHPDCVVLFRMGDFYETFYEDAITASKVLDITLTARGKGESRAPLAGIPYHALNTYLPKLVNAGYKVAICEQTEDPRTVKGRIVNRAVTRIVTPGTVVEDSMLDAKSNNYIFSIYQKLDKYALAIIDLSTGEFFVIEVDENQLKNEITRFKPKEVLIPESLKVNKDLIKMLELNSVFINTYSDYHYITEHSYNYLLRHFNTINLKGFGLDKDQLTINSAGALINYLNETQKTNLDYINKIKIFSPNDFMILDSTTQRNLELLKNILDNSAKGSLLSTLDKTNTSVGGRLMKKIILQPLLSTSNINQRFDSVEELKDNVMLSQDLIRLLKQLNDVERIIAKINYGNANSRDLVALKNSFHIIPKIKELLVETNSQLLKQTSEIKDMNSITDLISKSIKEEPNVSVREGNMIKQGYNKELDELRNITTNTKQWIASLESEEKKKTGIGSLRIGFNKVFGYYITISKANLDKVPDNYIRKQTLVNAERFITPELKEKESLILNAEEKINNLEYDLFVDMCNKIKQYTTQIQEVSNKIGMLDVLLSFSTVAKDNNYVRPIINNENKIELKDCRHPVVELIEDIFVPNDIIIDNDQRLLIITGPNMSGKCLTGNTLIFSEKGLVPLISFKPEGILEGEFKPLKTKICGKNGYEYTSQYYYDGMRSTITITTKFGYKVEGTSNHPIFVRTKQGKEVWKKLKDIRKSDFVVIKRDINLWGNRTEVDKSLIKEVKAYNYNRNVKQYKLPNKIDQDLAYFIGLLIGDGSLTYKIRITLSNIDNEIINDLFRISKEKFGYVPKAQKNKKDYCITSRQIRLYLEKIGLDYNNSLNKVVPHTILQAPKSIVKSFLQGLFDTDGTTSKKYGYMSLSTSSYELAKQVQLLLLNFGIIASLKPKKTKRNINYRVSIYGENSILFYKLIGFKVKRKSLRKGLVSKLRMPNYGIPYMNNTLKEIQHKIVNNVNKILALKRVKLINSIFYTYIPTKRNISYRKLKELIDYCKLNEISCEELETIYKNNYFYDSIISIESSNNKKPVYDFTVPGSHSFIANGIINHNSVAMRQVALIQLMTQLGSFVPATKANICLVDRIFTRVGAYDDLTHGQSTFMVEMNETANILNNATENSLVILDEIGRGTSTFDGISLAWSIAEYIHNKIGAKTLFATHYHQMNKLQEKLKSVKNYNIAIKEKHDEIIFLRKIVQGGTDKSYGIQVAKLAGLPSEVIERSKQIMNRLEMEDKIAERVHKPLKEQKPIEAHHPTSRPPTPGTVSGQSTVEMSEAKASEHDQKSKISDMTVEKSKTEKEQETTKIKETEQEPTHRKDMKQVRLDEL